MRWAGSSPEDHPYRTGPAGGASKLADMISLNDYSIVSLNGDGGDYQDALAGYVAKEPAL